MAFTRKDVQAGFRIGECLIEPRKNGIVRSDVEARVEPRVMDVLVCLAEHAGEVVSRETLNAQVWGNVVVTDQAVTNCISELRQHLGDDRSAHRVIETIPKRGYRLAAPLRLAQGQVPDPAPVIAAAPARRPWMLAAGVLVAAGVVVAWWQGRAASPAHTSVAVLHFENAAGDESLDYLRLA